MADPRLRPRGVKPSSTNGDVLTTTGGVAVWAAPAVAPTLVPLVTMVDGTPGLVFDDDGHVVYMEESA